MIIGNSIIIEIIAVYYYRAEDGPTIEYTNLHLNLTHTNAQQVISELRLFPDKPVS